MSPDGPADYLDHYLEPLAPLLADDQITDLFINRPGELWIERLGGEVCLRSAPELDARRLHRLVRQVAAHAHQGLSRTHPLLSATLPGGARIQVVLPPATPEHVAIAIRRHRAMALPLSAYLMDPSPRADAPPTECDRLADYLSEAVRRRWNIVISGGTSSGKTTLLNSLVSEIPRSERLISIEDARELQMDQPNCVHLIAARGGQGEAIVTSNDLLEASLRMRPDRILLGELRGGEAYTFLRAINTGHPGSMTTLHADSPEGAVVQLAMMIVQGAPNLDFDNALQLVRGMVDVVVQVERRGGQRPITAISSLRGGTA
jgi:type IV secretion system protein VirB11